MLFYERVSVSEGIDVNISKEGSVCFYYFFIDKNFTYQPYLYNGCHGASMRATNISDIYIIYPKNNCSRVVGNNLTRPECQKLINENNLTDTIGYL